MWALSLLLLSHQACLLSCIPAVTVMNSHHFGIISLNKIFFLSVVSVMMFYQSTRKLTNTPVFLDRRVGIVGWTSAGSLFVVRRDLPAHWAQTPRIQLGCIVFCPVWQPELSETKESDWSKREEGFHQNCGHSLTLLVSIGTLTVKKLHLFNKLLPTC